MGTDRQWQDNMTVPSGQPADLNLILNIISNLYSLKEETLDVRGRIKLASDTIYRNDKTKMRIDVGHKGHGHVVLSKHGSSGSHYVPFTKPFAAAPVVVAQARTYKGHKAATTVNIHSVTTKGFSVTYWGHQNKIARGVMYIAIGM